MQLMLDLYLFHIQHFSYFPGIFRLHVFGIGLQRKNIQNAHSGLASTNHVQLILSIFLIIEVKQTDFTLPKTPPPARLEFFLQINNEVTKL